MHLLVRADEHVQGGIMADLGTVQVLTNNPVEVTGGTLMPVDHGIVELVSAPCPPAATPPTTGQLWPRGAGQG